MADPTTSNGYNYGAGGRTTWTTAAGDGMPLTMPSDDMTNSSWSDFMAWDPNAASVTGEKPGDSSYSLKQQQQQQQHSHDYHHRADPQVNHPTYGFQANGAPSSATMGAPSVNAPFSFGDNLDNTPAFNFNGHALTSPLVGHGQHSYGSQTLWQAPQSQEGPAFPAPTFDRSQAPIEPSSSVSITPSLQQSQSPPSVQNGLTSPLSVNSTPEPKNKRKKRRASRSAEDSPPESKKGKVQPPQKTAHNMIEKRYRNNINDKIIALRDSVPSLRAMLKGNTTGEDEDEPEDLDGLTPAHKLNKATILSKATEYIKHLEKANKRLEGEKAALQARIDSYEKVPIAGSVPLHGNVSTPESSRYAANDPFSPSNHMAIAGPPQGMIPVPEHIANLRQGLPPQPHYAPAYPPFSGSSRSTNNGVPIVNSRMSTGMMGKVIVGSLAGMMMVECFSQSTSSEEPAGRGLYAFPINFASIFAARVSLGPTSAQIPLAKLALIFASFFYVFGHLFQSRANSQKQTRQTSKLVRAPSLASPVRFRRHAWLVAIQTVWVPRHNLLLELVALALKTFKLSTRKLVGWSGYSFLTGITREQEAARVKAWTIALNAQLTGGDADISKSRLVLTLMASGTLPDTPGRLMLKALHIRVLLWELANAGHGLSWVLDGLSAKLSRSYWNSARSEQRIAANAATKVNSSVERLPEHLAVLLEKECDDVLVPCIVQRAYNLAWNKPIAAGTVVDSSMDGVVEDFAISSPLDALAAWYSSFILTQSIVGYLATIDGKASESITDSLEFAAKIAPPTSQAQLRSLVAQAVILDDCDRAARLATATGVLQLPSSASTTKWASLLNLVEGGPVAVDVQKAMTLTKCRSLVERGNAEAYVKAVHVVNNFHLPEDDTTLLSFVAAYNVLDHFMQDPLLQADTSFGLERLAGSLRLWVGRDIGRRSGLTNGVRGKLVSRCLDASRVLVGLAEKEEVDPGYVSSSVMDKDEEFEQ